MAAIDHAKGALVYLRNTTYYKDWMNKVQNGTSNPKRSPAEWQGLWINTQLYKCEQEILATINELSQSTPIPPEPIPSGILFGTHHAIQEQRYEREAQENAAVGAQIVRTDYYAGGPQDYVISAAKAVGIRRFSLIIGGDRATPPTDIKAYCDLAIKAAKENPDAFLEGCNEPGGRWTPQQIVDVNNAMYAAVRGAGCANPILMSSLSGSEPSPKHGTNQGAREWCRMLKAAGCAKGKTADIFNCHAYGPKSIETGWMYYWTKGSDGTSCMSILGFDKFAITEFGSPLSGTGAGPITETQQALNLRDWFDFLRASTGFVFGTWYAMSDNAGPSANHYGLVVPADSWRRRPAWTTFREKVG